MRDYDLTVFVNDDASTDGTYEIVKEYEKNCIFPKFIVRKNRKNLGYGGNQKIGFEFAVKNNYDWTILLHGDGQYFPEYIPNLIQCGTETRSDIILGSRMLNKKDAIKGGMPLYKWLGNILLTYIQNFLLASKLSEFHTGLRMYSSKFLSNTPLTSFSNEFHFDTQILIFAIIKKFSISEIPIKTYYGDEVSYVNVIKYGLNVLFETWKARNIVKWRHSDE